MNYDRKLTSIEQAMEILNQHNGSFNVITISQIQGKLPENIVRQSLELVQQRHPRLNSRIINSDLSDELYFKTEDTEQIPLKVIVQNESQSWQDLVVNELNQPINSSKYLLECFLLYHKSSPEKIWFLTKIHHAICDGLSTIQLHAEILENCQKLNSSIPLEFTNKLPALPPLLELLPKWMHGWQGWMNELIFISKLQLQEKLYSPQILKPEQQVSPLLRSCGMVHTSLDRNITQQLIQLCRQEKTTIQGVLCAAILLAIRKQIIISESLNINLACHSYVDLRRRLLPQVSQDNLGLLASFLASFHRLNSETKFWDLARDVTKQNQTGLQKGDFFKPTRIYGKIIKHFLANPHKNSISAAVTNIGRVNIIQDYGLFQLEEISFIPANSVFASVFTAAVATYNHKMIVNFTFSKPSISQEKAESMADYVISLLTKICSNKKL